VEVHDGSTQVRVEGLVGAKMGETSDAADERVVHEILRLRAVLGEEERQSVGDRDMPDVQVGQLALGLRHRRPLLHLGLVLAPYESSRHTLKTREAPGRYRRTRIPVSRWSPRPVG
jgi:hypothetical protein